MHISSRAPQPFPKPRLPRLSKAEQEQLGEPSNSRWIPDAEEWKGVRSFLLAKSQKREPNLRPEMTAYTPGETRDLMRQPEISAWHKQVVKTKIPDDVDLVVFVPCAATKPWENATKGIYKSYNRLREEGEFPRAYFVTISEPLGVVPESRWADFPLYDNPGLFRNDSARAGRTTTKEWLQEFGKNFVVPFDEAAYDECIDGLSDVIADFARNNQKPGREFVSFVNDSSGVSTHTDMLRRANEKFEFLPEENMYLKRAAPREEPYEYVREKLREHQ